MATFVIKVSCYIFNQIVRGREGTVGWGLGDTINRTVEYIGRIAQRVKAMEQNVDLTNTVVGTNFEYF